MPAVFGASPLVASTVAGLKGTPLSVEPRVASVAHAASERSLTSMKLPVPGGTTVTRETSTAITAAATA